MGLVFTILFIIATYLSPAVIYPPLAQYRVSFTLGICAILCSIPGIVVNKPWKLMQCYLWIGMLGIVVISQVVNGWYGGALIAGNSFFITSVVFFLVVANCNSVIRLKWLALAVCLVTGYTVFLGAGQYWALSRSSDFILWQNTGDLAIGINGWLHRLRARGTIGDPNDFAQVLAVCIAFTFLWYKPKKYAWNVALVLLPSAYLFYGMTLTHSRGSIFGLGILLLMTLRKKLGTAGATVLSVGMGFGLLALGYSGGRGVNSTEGYDRLSAWGQGLQLFKHHPIFGVGFGSFTEHFQLTAHNSFVLAFSELGFIGYFCWLGMIVTAFLGLQWVMARQSPVAAAVEQQVEQQEEPEMAMAMMAGANDSPLRMSVEKATPVKVPALWEMDYQERKTYKQDRDLVQAAGVVQAALIAFLTCAWFLSRSYVMTLYIILGMSASLVLIAMKRDPERAFVPLKKLVRYTLVAEVLSIALVWILVRSGHVI